LSFCHERPYHRERESAPFVVTDTVCEVAGACQLLRQGTNHAIWNNAARDLRAPAPGTVGFRPAQRGRSAGSSESRPQGVALTFAATRESTLHNKPGPPNVPSGSVLDAVPTNRAARKSEKCRIAGNFVPRSRRPDSSRDPFTTSLTKTSGIGSVELADRVARHPLIDQRAAQSMYVAIDHVRRADPLVSISSAMTAPTSPTLCRSQQRRARLRQPAVHSSGDSGRPPR
jgi:hypothetical protein